MHDFPLIATVAAGFTAAWILGLFTQQLRLSPIVGYLLAGVLIGPHTPGFKGDLHLAHQLAEVGVILLMFGVGLHFHLSDLLAVKWIAIPGALGQSLVATLAGVVIFSLFGMPAKTGAVIGMAIAVASTVVLMRVLIDADALNSTPGHVAVGWLLVEDVLTVIVLVLIPVLGVAPESVAAPEAGAAAPTDGRGVLLAIGIALVKLAALVGIVILLGARIVPWVLTQVARLRSRELFTLTVMVFSIALAAGAYALFGASMALGAFLAGMMVAQSPVSHQAAADALPLRDAFAVLFFVSVGMLFDPMFLIREPLMMLAALGIILLIKPLIALVIVMVLGHSVRTALTVALGLAQIGEFSFILSDLSRKHGLMPDEGHNLLVGGAILSITLNPILFRMIPQIERWLKRRPKLWARLNARAERRIRAANREVIEQLCRPLAEGKRQAIVVGYGPVGRTVDRLLRDAGLETVIIDMNMDTIAAVRQQGHGAIFGDASRAAILESAGVDRASHLVLTVPESADRAAIVAAARDLNPRVKVFVRARYLRERGELEQVGATAAIFEEAEAAVALARLVLADAGAARGSIESAVRDIRTQLILDNVSNLRRRAVRDIMVPWSRVRRILNTAGDDEVRWQVTEQHFSRWPVINAESGQPMGYLLAKDLIGLKTTGGDWNELIRPLAAVGPDDDIEATLQRFQRELATIFLVTDTDRPVGIVTIEDVLEQVVGRIEDEYPRHAPVVLRDVFVTDDDLLDLSGTTSDAVIAEMAAKVPPGRVPPGADIAQLAIRREREMPTNIGGGVALPHARCPGLEQPLVVFGRSGSGVVFGSADTEPVRLVFLLITPADRPNTQVQLLGQVDRLVRDGESRRQLVDAATADDVRQVLASVGARRQL